MVGGIEISLYIKAFHHCAVKCLILINVEYFSATVAVTVFPAAWFI